ncbi:MAG: DNA double-strand break repair nuclease NurA, partial [Candidatus Bipolaricaulota bacterium]|nr:DNA double-strand break repair nuclease NurA [Candidatus Bipolaricaulota bacterium]
MLSLDVRRLFFGELKVMGERARRGPDHRDVARQLFENLHLEGAIKALTPVARRSEPILTLAEFTRDPFGIAYGLDGGSTRPMQFTDGTTLCANQAVLVPDPHSKYQNLTLETWRTVAVVSHSFQNLGEARVHYIEQEHTHAWRIHLTQDFVRREVEQIVKGLADVATEPHHALKMIEKLDLKGGLLIVDGALYPIRLFRYLLEESQGSWGYRWHINLTSLAGVLDLMAGPVRLVELCAQRRLPLIAINKTPETEWFLKFCLERDQQHWANDRQFFSAVLSDTPKDSLGYTNWFVQEAYPSWDEPNREIELPRAITDFSFALEASAYHVAFFYLYDPRVGSALKI